MTEQDKIDEMVKMSKYPDALLQKKFFEAYSLRDALELIAKLAKK